MHSRQYEIQLRDRTVGRTASHVAGYIRRVVVMRGTTSLLFIANEPDADHFDDNIGSICDLLTCR